MAARGGAHLQLAEYLSGLQQTLKGRLASPEWAAARRVAGHRKAELALCVDQERAVRRRIDLAKRRKSGSPDPGAPGAVVGSQLGRRRGDHPATTSGANPSALERSSRVVGGDGWSTTENSGAPLDLEELRRELEELRRELTALHRHRTLLEREVAIDAAEMRSATAAAGQCLLDALAHYRRALVVSGSGRQLRTVFRVVKMWLDNDANSAVNHEVALMVAEVPSYKWLPLTYQLSSRLGTDPKASHAAGGGGGGGGGDEDDDEDDDDNVEVLGDPTRARRGGGSARLRPVTTFAEVLQRLLWRLCSEHPHHSLLQVFALANGDKM